MSNAGCQLLTPLILATQEAEIRRIMVRSQPRQIVRETFILKKIHHKTGMVEWFKLKALSSKPRTGKKIHEQ
jgi:hypothetical protein